MSRMADWLIGVEELVSPALRQGKVLKAVDAVLDDPVCGAGPGSLRLAADGLETFGTYWGEEYGQDWRQRALETAGLLRKAAGKIAG